MTSLLMYGGCMKNPPDNGLIHQPPLLFQPFYYSFFTPNKEFLSSIMYNRGSLYDFNILLHRHIFTGHLYIFLFQMVVHKCHTLFNLPLGRENKYYKLSIIRQINIHTNLPFGVEGR